MPRLPSSLKWLIDRRGRVDGEIKKIEASLAKCQRLATALEDLKARLASIDATMDLHEIQIDPKNIPTIRSQYVRVNLPHGELTRSIVLCLKLNEGLPISTEAITSFVVARCADLDTEQEHFSRLKSSVRRAGPAKLDSWISGSLASQ